MGAHHQGDHEGPIRMLVVDDEPDLQTLIRQKFRKQIRDNRYEFLFASDGAEALRSEKVAPSGQLKTNDLRNIDNFLSMLWRQSPSPLTLRILFVEMAARQSASRKKGKEWLILARGASPGKNT